MALNGLWALPTLLATRSNMKWGGVEMLDRSVNAGVVGFRGSTQPTGDNLLAEEDTLPANNFNSIGINTFPDANSTELLPNTLEAINTSKVTINPNGTVSVTNPLKIGVAQIGIGENNIFHRTSSEVNVATITTSPKTGISEIGSSQIRSIDTNTIKSGSEQTSTAKIGIIDETSIK